MSEQTYKLVSWQGDVQGTFSAEKILEMWESEEITGLYQVVTETGNLSVQEFARFAEEVAEKNRQHQQQVAEAQAEAEAIRDWKAEEEEKGRKEKGGRGGRRVRGVHVENHKRQGPPVVLRKHEPASIGRLVVRAASK